MNTEQRDTPKHWQDEDLMFRYHNDARFHKFVKEIIFYALQRALPQIPERNAAGIAYPSIQTQKDFWEQRDIGGNTTPDKIQANLDRYGIGKQPWDSEPVESWDVDFEHE